MTLFANHVAIQLNKKNTFGDTALTLAAVGGHRDTVQVLMRAQADVNQKGSDGYHALLNAATDGHHQVVSLLLSEPEINMDLQADNGLTAMRSAVEARQFLSAFELMKAKLHRRLRCTEKLSLRKGLLAYAPVRRNWLELSFCKASSNEPGIITSRSDRRSSHLRQARFMRGRPWTWVARCFRL